MQNEFAGFCRPGKRGESFGYSLDEDRLFGLVAVSVITFVEQVDQSLFDLARTITSQSLQQIEWLVVSPEFGINHSDEIVAEISGLLHRHCVRTFNGKDRQLAVRDASGRYICFINAGTELDPTYLEKCVWLLDAKPELAFCNTLGVMLGEGEATFSGKFGDGLPYLYNMANDGVLFRSLIAKRNIENNARLTSGKEQTELILEIAEKQGQWGHTIPEYLYWTTDTSVCSLNSDVRELIRSRHLTILADFVPPCSVDLQPYEPLRTDFPVSNILHKKHLRVLFVVPWMVTGGADKFNLDLIQMLTDRGYEVSLCATIQAVHEWEHIFAKYTSDIFVLSNFLAERDYPRFLSYLIKSRRIDTVLISGSTLGYQFLPYLRACSPDTSFVDLCHVAELHWNSGGHPRFGVGYQDLLDLNIVSTAKLSEWMVERGAKQERIRILYTGIDLVLDNAKSCSRAQIRHELDIAHDLPIIIFAGRICQQKRPDVLAEILKGLRDAKLPFHALIVGDGELRKAFEGMLGAYELQKCVSMLGAISHDRWTTLLTAADIFLLPSDYEGISIALLEAMSAGVVPVVSDVGGQSEIVKDGAGYLISHGKFEVAEYMRAIEKLLLSDELRQKMGKNAIKLIESKFSKRVTAESFESILAESRRLCISSPRIQMPESLAREFVTASIELNRLSLVVQWLWGSSQKENKQYIETMDWLLLFRKTKVGHILHKNRWLREIWLLLKI